MCLRICLLDIEGQMAKMAPIPLCCPDLGEKMDEMLSDGSLA